MDMIFQIVDWLAPIIRPEGVFTLKVVAVFLTSYYTLAGIPVLLSTWVACRLIWHR